MGWKMAQLLIWKLIILCVIFSTLVVPGSTGFISPSQEPFSLITTVEESAVGDGPATAPQSNGFPQPPLKSPPIVQIINWSAPVFAPIEYATFPPHDSAPPLPSISPHASAPPPPVLAVLPHASTPPPPILEVPPTSAPPLPILEIPPHAFPPPSPILGVRPNAFTPPPPIQAVPPHAPTLPPLIPPEAPLASPPFAPILEGPPHASAPPPTIVEVPPHASAPSPPILGVPAHASTSPPSIVEVPPHASTPPQSILAVPPHASTPPPLIPLEPPFASTPPLPTIAIPPLVVASPPPVPLHASTPPPPILTKSPRASTLSPPALEVPPHASKMPSPILEVPPHVSTPPLPALVVPPHAPSPPSPNLIVQPPSAPLQPIQAMPPATTPPPPILKVSPPASTPPPPILKVSPPASTPPPPNLPEAPLSSEPSPPILEVPPHDSTSPPQILPEAPFVSAPPPPILEVPPHASAPQPHALPKHAPPPLFVIAVPPNVSAPPHNSLPSPSLVHPNVSAQPPQGTPIPASPPIPVTALPPVSNSIPSHDALPESPSVPPVSLPLLSPGSVPPPTPPSSLNAPQASAQPPSGLPTRALSPVSSAVPRLPNALAPSHHALPQAPAMPPRALSPQPPGSPGLPTRALSPASSVVSPPPNDFAASHHSLPQAPTVPPHVLSLPPPGSPPPVSIPSVPLMPPNALAPPPTLPPSSPLVRPFSPTQPPSRLPKKALSPPPFVVSKPPNISSASNKPRPLQPTMSPLGSSEPPSGLSVQVSAPTPSTLPLSRNVSAPPHNFSTVLPTVPPPASAQPPSPPAVMPTPINISSPPMNVVRQHAQTPKPVAGSLSPQASSAPGSTKSSDASTPASVVDQQNAPSVSPLTSRNQGQYGRHKASSTVASAPGGFENPPLYAPRPVNQHTQPSPRYTGSSEVNIPSPSPSVMGNIILGPPPSVIAPSGYSEIPVVSPKISPARSSTKNPKRPLAAPIIALPPPPPNEDCAYLTCTEPLTNTPPGSPCGCVYPMQVRLRLSVDLYTFFPLVLELARETAAGVFMKQSQVRIMGANAALQQPEKTDVLIDLVPLGEKFDNVTAFLTFQRFWHKQVSIDRSLFGSYEVLYVHYPGLPPSPPVASSDMAVINGDPSSGQDAGDVHPLAVDVSGQRHKHGLSGALIAVIVFSAVATLVLSLSIAWVVLVKRRKNVPEQPISHAQISSQTRHSVHSGGSGPSSASLSLESSIAAYTGSAKTFSLSEIEKATDNFNPSKVLGEGGFGLVYSGILEDGTKIAVKVLKRDDQQGGREFLAEVEMLSRLHHRNLVKLIGICVEERTRCLVYELVPNGSVDSHLHGMDKETSPLEWAIRMKIALGAARGLAYLHEDSSPRVIHRDFKASNILLENDFTPKVSDFGLARTGMEEESRHISTRVMGTFGYVAPEYAMTGHLLVKSDVYSYGVVLLELLTGRKPVDMSQPPGQENLVAWTRPLLTSKEGLESIIDPSLGHNISYNSIAKVAAIASMCVQPEVSHRPFMGEVVQALKLVCNECEDTKDDVESTRTSCSHENLSPDFDPRMSPVSGEMLNPSQSELTIHSCVSGHDLERGVSVSDIFSASERVGRQACGSSRRHSAPGPVRVRRRDRWFWHKTRSRGSISENGIMHKFWSGSH